MKEQLILFETAKLAKEKGFNIPILNYFQITVMKNPSELSTYTKSNWNNYNVTISRPTQSLLQKWLRETHNSGVYVLPYHQIRTNYEVLVVKSNITYSGYNSYEDALEEGLKHALNLIKI
jgi:hypothetical protein